MINPTQFAQNTAFWTFDLDDAVRYLSEDFPIRRIDEVLANAIKQKAQERNTTEEEMKSVLRKALGSKARSLRNWLIPGMVKSISRESAIQIAFALHMSYEEAEGFLKRLWLDGFYMRDVMDVIYRYGLENRWSYEPTTKMVQAFAYLNHCNPEPDGSDAVHREDLTRYLNALYENAVNTVKDLENFIKKNEQFFGTFRRKAYERFKELYDQLEQEWDDVAHLDIELDVYAEEAQAYTRDTVSMGELCDVIVKGIPEMKKRGTNTIIRRCITEHIPTRTVMSEIINKSERDGKITQVDRKLLILAWLSSEDGDMLDFQSGNAEDDLKEHLNVLNIDLLEQCGMAALDPRHPFDWIVMNSLYCAYILGEKDKAVDDVEDRMKKLIERM